MNEISCLDNHYESILRRKSMRLPSVIEIEKLNICSQFCFDEQRCKKKLSYLASTSVHRHNKDRPKWALGDYTVNRQLHWWGFLRHLLSISVTCCKYRWPYHCTKQAGDCRLIEFHALLPQCKTTVSESSHIDEDTNEELQTYCTRSSLWCVYQTLRNQSNFDKCLRKI